jgi:hypothetical protein
MPPAQAVPDQLFLYAVPHPLHLDSVDRHISGTAASGTPPPSRTRSAQRTFPNQIRGVHTVNEGHPWWQNIRNKWCQFLDSELRKQPEEQNRPITLDVEVFATPPAHSPLERDDAALLALRALDDPPQLHHAFIRVPGEAKREVAATAGRALDGEYDSLNVSTRGIQQVLTRRVYPSRHAPSSGY